MSVLIADDDASARSLLQEVLHTRLKLDVVVAENGAQAWKYLEDGLRPDLLISDVMMPEVTGFELLEKVRKHKDLRGLKVIFCSFLSEREILPTGARLGLHCYILKPYRPELVEEKVLQAMRDLPSNGIASRSAICARLHINERALERLHLQLKYEIEKSVGELRNMVERGEIGAAALKVARLRSSTANLGAIGLEERFQKVEQALYQTRHFPESWVELSKKEGEENQKYRDYLEKLIDLIDDVEVENERFEDAIRPNTR